jgi:hypothetical protein
VNEDIINERRIGDFTILNHDIRDHNYADVLKSVFGTLIIVRAEQMWHYDGIVYQAYCREFEMVPKGKKAPIYNLTVNADGFKWELSP